MPFGRRLRKMKVSESIAPIPREVAVRLCAEVSSAKKGKMFTQCWGCWKFSKGDPEKMCFNGPANRGCQLVNQLYDRSSATG